MSVSNISKLRKFAAVNSTFTRLMSSLSPKQPTVDYNKYVKISRNLDKDTFEYVNGIKETLGKYAKRKNIEVTIDPVKKEPSKVSINIFSRENPVMEKIYDFLELIHDEIEAKNKINEGDKIEGTITRIKHFGAFVEVFPGVEALLPNNEVVDYQNKNNCILASGE